MHRLLRLDLLLLAALLSGANGCHTHTEPPDPTASVLHLTALLNDQDPQVRFAAAQALGKIASPDTVPALLHSLHDNDPAVRAVSAWALGNLGEDVLDQAGPELVARLDDPSPFVKRAAAQALGAVGSTPATIERVTERLAHGDIDTRRAAVQALIWLESGPAYRTLIKALNDPDPQVRQGAVAALGEMVDPRALPAIRDRLLKDVDAGVRGEAAYRLGKFGDRTVAPALKTAAARDPDPAVRRWAVWALEQIESATVQLRTS